MSIRSLTHLHSLLLYHHITIASAIILWLPTACHDQLHSLYSAVHTLSSAPTSISPYPSLSVSFSPSVHEMLMHASEGRQVQGAYFIYFITISSMIIIIIFIVTGGAAAIRERDRERGRQEQSRGKQSPTIPSTNGWISICNVYPIIIIISGSCMSHPLLWVVECWNECSQAVFGWLTIDGSVTMGRCLFVGEESLPKITPFAMIYSNATTKKPA